MPKTSHSKKKQRKSKQLPKIFEDRFTWDNGLEKKEIERLLPLTDSFSKKKILVIGDLVVDKFVRGSVGRISPEAPVPVVEVASEDYLPGGSGNVASNLRALGAEVYAAGVLGNDPVGMRFIEDFKNMGINTDAVVIDPNRPTSLKTRVIAEHQQVVRFDRETKEAINSSCEKKLIAMVTEVAQKCDAVIFSDYLKGVLTGKLIRSTMDSLRCKNKSLRIPIIAGSKPKSFFNYNRVWAASLNLAEARAVLNLSSSDLDYEIEPLGRRLLSRLNSKALLITLGSKGMALFERGRHSDKCTIIPVTAKEVYDVTGAGDTALATFTTTVASGGDFVTATVLANYAAGVVVGKLGTATCTPEELKKTLVRSNNGGRA